MNFSGEFLDPNQNQMKLWFCFILFWHIQIAGTNWWIQFNQYQYWPSKTTCVAAGEMALDKNVTERRKKKQSLDLGVPIHTHTMLDHSRGPDKSSN